MKNNIKLPIYMDYQSTTPIDPRVVDAMMPYFYEKFGNPHSRTHSYGWDAENAIEISRKHVADLIGADPKEIIFLSGATEANNLALKGVASFYKNTKNHIITLKTEHKCILNAARFLSSQGFEVTYLPVKANGIVDLDLLKDSIKENTLLVSIMAVNNEIGVIQPLEEIGKICREKNVFFHSDIAQGFGKIPIDVNKCNIDLASISAHKIYGPKGVGALYVRRKPRVKLHPLIDGGGQERGMRSGTLSPALVAGFGEASRIAKIEMKEDLDKVKKYFDRIYDSITSKIPEVYLNGDKMERYYGNINLSFAYVEGESIIMAIKDIAVSSGSACTSSSLEPSYVLKALGVTEDMAHTSIRFGVGRFTTDEEVDYMINLVISKIEKLRTLSPLWEMAQEGIDLKQIKWTTH